VGTPPNALILPRSEAHQSHFGAVLKELLSLAAVTGERPKDVIRAEIPTSRLSQAVWFSGSIRFCGSLSHNNHNKNVPWTPENVLQRFAARY
jgi:N,N-dimethylformamidase